MAWAASFFSFCGILGTPANVDLTILLDKSILFITEVPMTTTKAIRAKLATRPAGEAFTPALFAGLGSRASIDMALMRMAKAGTIERLGRGIYHVPKVGRFGIPTTPSVEQIVETVAASEGAALEVHGAEAARRFGLSTQMPTRPVFNTSGANRRIHVGKLIVELRHVASRKMVLAGRPAGQALSALWYLGRHEVTTATFAQLKAKLSQEEFQVLRKAQPSMPSWMSNALINYEREGAHAELLRA